MSEEASISKLRTLSLDTLAEVEAIRLEFSVHRTVWYFEALDDDAAEDWEVAGPFWSEVKREITDRFPTIDADVVGGHVGVELIDNCAPTPDWLNARMSEMSDFADAAALFLRGWAYEPEGHPAGAPPQAFVSQAKRPVR